MFGNVYTLGDQWDRGQTDESLIRYILGLSNVSDKEKYLILFQKKYTQHQHMPTEKYLSLRLS